ncbi:hypothetical protein FFLO_04869 [Filobasidium floriforme]|uniref:Uncharacterized protein n=2 Tax=Filobasidium floriforme TaxID=5210 RepID=A0A8K0JI40_9TREE|nr:hypothetical protein FFLO_04869 [Filobasidium floriforme]
MKRIALEALFEMGVRGEAANSIAAQSGLTTKQVGDLFRTNRQNMRSKAMAIFDSGGL